MPGSEGREGLLRASAALLRGETPGLPPLLAEVRHAEPIAVRTTLPELLTAIVLSGVGPDDEVIEIVADSAERFPSLDEHSPRAIADDHAVAHLLAALGAGDVIEASGGAGSPDAPADWEARGRLLADSAALAVPGTDPPSPCARRDLVRAAVLETASFHPRTAMRILRWSPFVEEPATGDGLERELMDHLARQWPDDPEVAFGRAVLRSLRA